MVRPGCCSLHRRKGHGQGCRSSPALSKLSSLLSISGEFTPVRWLYEKNSKSYYVLIPRSAPFCGLTIIELHGGMTALVTAVSPSHHRCTVKSCGKEESPLSSPPLLEEIEKETKYISGSKSIR